MPLSTIVLPPPLLLFMPPIPDKPQSGCPDDCVPMMARKMLGSIVSQDTPMVPGETTECLFCDSITLGAGTFTEALETQALYTAQVGAIALRRLSMAVTVTPGLCKGCAGDTPPDHVASHAIVLLLDSRTHGTRF